MVDSNCDDDKNGTFATTLLHLAVFCVVFGHLYRLSDNVQLAGSHTHSN